MQLKIDSSVATDALHYIEIERAQFKNEFKLILQICRERKIIVDEPSWLVDDKIPTDFTPTKLLLFSDDLVNDAKFITDKLAGLRPNLVVMRSKFPHREIDIFASGRLLVSILKHIGVADYTELSTPPLRVLSAHTTLIDIYHNLYIPFPENFKKNLIIEAALYKIIQPKPLDFIEDSTNPILKFVEAKEEVLAGGAQNETLVQKLRKILDENNLGLIIGFWGAQEIVGNIDTKYEKIQIITDKTPENLADYFKALGTITHMSYDIRFRDDYWLVKTTFYIKKNSDDPHDRVPILDAYNAMTYELVPRLLIKGSFTGTIFVIMRYFIIDYWMLHQLWKNGKIIEKIFRDKTEKIMKTIGLIRPYKKYWFSPDYVGVYKDLVIEKRLLAKTQKKIGDYHPRET